MKDDYKFHELCTLFPIHEEELEDLTENIKKNGLIDPIVKYKGEIIDGRTRALACQKANIEPVYRELNTSLDLSEYVIAKNLKRRHLSSAEKIEIGIKICEYMKKLESTDKKPSEKDIAIKEYKENQMIAEKVNSKLVNVERVKKILEKAKKDPDIEKEWEKTKRNKSSITKTYSLISPAKKRNKKISYKQKSKNLELELSFYKQLINASKELGLYQQILNHIIPKLEETKSPYTISDYRKAELI